MSVFLEVTTTCLSCSKPLYGRPDKKFCNAGCKNEYNNRLQRQERQDINKIDLILKHNRRILKQWLDSASSRKASKSELMQLGFHFEYYTHHYTNYKQDRYCFCYEYGYLPLEDEKYLVVKKKETITI